LKKVAKFEKLFLSLRRCFAGLQRQPKREKQPKESVSNDISTPGISQVSQTQVDVAAETPTSLYISKGNALQMYNKSVGDCCLSTVWAFG
jgi:hypothetical protein